MVIQSSQRLQLLCRGSSSERLSRVPEEQESRSCAEEVQSSMSLTRCSDGDFPRGFETMYGIAHHSLGCLCTMRWEQNKDTLFSLILTIL